MIELQRDVLAFLKDRAGDALTAHEIATGLNRSDDAERIHHLLTHAAANPDHAVTMSCDDEAVVRFQPTV